MTEGKTRIMDQQEFLARVRAEEGLSRAVLRKIVVDVRAKKCLFELVTDAAYPAASEQAALAAAEEAAPAGFSAQIRIRKHVADPQLVRHAILRFLSENYSAAAACIRDEDIEVELGDPVLFTFGVDETERGYFERNPALMENVETMLSHSFCNAFRGGLTDKEKGGVPSDEEEDDADELPSDDDYRPVRNFPVVDFEGIDLAEAPRLATYISDCTFASDTLTVCGEITHIQERETQKGKPYIRFTISDKTGALSFSYFPRKKTEAKIRELKEGDSIVCTGANELYNERLSYTARYINRGAQPAGFVPEKRKGRPVPARYTTVRPEKIVDYNQLNLFEQAALPDDLVNNSFVVFDLETTGLVNTPTGGNMDAITEIGAIKIVGGEIREKFTTFVDPQRKLDAEIVRLTGITDEMLKGAPKIAEVIPDFYKFCDGCYLVGHNVQFDYKFIQYYGAQEDYMFEQRTFDTMTIAQSFLFLSNYKLNTLADYYGVVFNHHRAGDDALATAKIFIELIKAKKCLPKA